ncbi:AbiH family protein [Acinetobacter sp. CFCC 10889]|uniref:AbiH family protein n=1 Tax=Acinetobacter sp. CFCC 10889 TaxID=1775557 RepID=UPI000DD0D257|nr:AbiH family protein [Acinetobacter sp. CFCC 10889]
MNILIVGNGFDLSHYLPTKYDHFMVAMDAIENWDSSKGDMGFDDLFGLLYEKEDYFFGYTKAMYHTDEIKISVDQVKELKEQLEENVWYQYFSDHVREVKTWIDFEQKIESALALAFKFIKKIHLKFEKYGKIDTTIRNLTKTNSDKDDEKIYIAELDMNLLNKLELFTVNRAYGAVIESGFGSLPDTRKGFINDNWLHVKEKSEYGFSTEKYISFLNNQLENFIEVFNLYLELVVRKLLPIGTFCIDSKDWTEPEKIFSFNYTNTYQRIHDSVKVDYLHGSHGEHQNIVLGVSDLEDESLKKIKAYGFTKYHQKLFKDTDYLFLDQYKAKILDKNKKEIYLKEQLKSEIRSSQRNDLGEKIKANTREQKLDLKIVVWGHSLDVSDKDYIIDLFSLNDDMDRNVRVIVYHFNKAAKFDLLNNLLAILGKDKVEHWMKNKWLQFKENPKIVPKSAITLDDLPQT